MSERRHAPPYTVRSRYTPSFVFIEFKNAHDAAFAQSAMDGHPFDSKHTFRVNRFTDIERYADMDETYVEPEPEEYKPKVCQLLLYPIYCFSDTMFA